MFREALQELEDARVAYRAWLALRPTDNSAWKRAGHAFLDVCRHQHALAVFAAMLERNPADTEAWCGKAEALARAGERRAAIAALEQALSLQPGWPAAAGRLKTLQAEEVAAARGKP